MNIETIGDRIYASFDDDRRFEVLFVTRKDNECFMKVLEHQKIRFYKIAEKDYNMLERKFFTKGLRTDHQQNKTD
jgi:hypothetical protein